MIRVFLCSPAKLPPEGDVRSYEVEHDSVIIAHWHGQYHAYRNSCPHRGIRLEWQPHQFLDPERQFLQCATHGALFRIEDGSCIAGPCPGERLEAVQLEITTDAIYLLS